jgi:hypothetical protein
MAKRSRAPARQSKTRARKTVRKARPPLSRRYSYTPELLASGRHRYERSEETITSIAVDFGIHKTTLQRMARRLGWVRYVAPVRDLPAAARLLAETEALEVSQGAATSLPLPERGRSPAAAEGEGGRVGVEAGAEVTPTLTLPSRTRVYPSSAMFKWPKSETSDFGSGGGNGETVARLHRAVLNELAAVEALRAQLKRAPQSPLDAERTARTLASLTETLHKLQRLQCAVPQSGPDYDDMPADLDEFRHELARRIRAFFAARRGRSDADGDAAPPVAEGG